MVIRVAAVSLILATSVSAEPASDEEMARQAMASYFPNSEQAMETQISKHRDRLREASENNPSDIKPARVFFVNGQSAEVIGQLASDFELEVIDVQLKAPLGGSGVVQSITDGMMDLLVVEGPLAIRLSAMIQRNHTCLQKWAEYLPPEEQKQYRELSAAQFRVYSARVAGTVGKLAALDEHDSVRVVMLRAGDVPESLLRDFESAKEQAPIQRSIILDPRFGMTCG